MKSIFETTGFISDSKIKIYRTGRGNGEIDIARVGGADVIRADEVNMLLKSI